MKKILTLLALTTLLLSAKTLVTVNGHPITDALLAEGYEKLDPTQKSNLIEQLIKEEVIYANLLSSPIVNNQQFQQAFSQQKNLVEQQYGKALNAEQLRSIKGSIAVSLYQQQEFQKAVIGVNQTKNFYQNNVDKFTFPNSIEIANIIVQDEASAKKILKSLQSSNNLDEDFLKAANAQKQNGYMGWFGRESMPTNLFDKAYKYKVKRLLNAPVKTKHGYNVVYLLNKKKAGKLSYAEAQPKIEQMLKQKQVMEKLKSKMENLYGSAQIVY
ncbi:MAG: Peptidylprolyl isomerase [uncultured Sulfurovum sp.]|uniref:peptidylprolyl isomerase n=1 Tax=uncultured Sulfurovum sp. TaxID=269237 RepID=A0A6S6TQ22_9BACT|nr:MAG: Peptidylprolyl isomerase [uncultured Sulfurovum sp.]